MPGTSDFAYVQARLQARHGLRPDAATWTRLEGAVDVPGLLRLIEGSCLAPWVDSLHETTDVHSLERALRQVWLNYVNAVAEWSPPGWRVAIRWIVVLLILPAMQHKRSGGAFPPWLQTDVNFRFLSDEFSHQIPRPFRGLPVASLQNATTEVSLSKAWQEVWRSLWPARSDRIARDLLSMVNLVEHHWDELGALDPPFSSAERLYALERDLHRRFRRGASTPVAIFCHLGLSALDLQRLRGNLVTRALFRDQPSLHQWQ